MIIRQQKTLSNNHYISTRKNAKTAFFITICAAESGMGIRLKNKLDSFIFQSAVCFWAKTNSLDGRREKFLVASSRQVAQKWR
ncbi:MAG: hypothetical protein NC337_08310 [Roseburia sp.]|nr:hypothetical protein [Roseburia sp.]